MPAVRSGPGRRLALLCASPAQAAASAARARAPSGPASGPEPGRNDVVVDRTRERVQIQVAVQAREQLAGAGARAARPGLDHAAAHQDAPGRGREHQGVQQLRQRVRRQCPTPGRAAESDVPACRRVPRSPRPRRAPRRSRRGRAGSAPVVARIARDANVAELGMAEAVHQPPAGDQSDADPGADGDVGEILEAPGRAPAPLGERRAVHVGIEGDRHPESLGQPPGDPGVAPAGLRRGGDESVGRRSCGPGRPDRTRRCRARGSDRASRRRRAGSVRFGRGSSWGHRRSGWRFATGCRPGPCRAGTRTSFRRVRRRPAGASRPSSRGGSGGKVTVVRGGGARRCGGCRGHGGEDVPQLGQGHHVEQRIVGLAALTPRPSKI